MKNFIAVFFLLVLTAGISACVAHPDAYKQPGRPEALLDYSSERVTFGLGTANALDDITAWINRDQPTKAEVSCFAFDASCEQLKRLLNQFNIPYQDVVSRDGGNSVVLVYDRVTARDCDNRYVDNAISNNLNLNHPTFGCSVAANSAQMVGDRSQFINPPLMDAHDAESGIRAIDKSYMKGHKWKGHECNKCSKPLSMRGGMAGEQCAFCPPASFQPARPAPIYRAPPPMEEPTPVVIPDTPVSPK